MERIGLIGAMLAGISIKWWLYHGTRNYQLASVGWILQFTPMTIISNLLRLRSGHGVIK